MIADLAIDLAYGALWCGILVAGVLACVGLRSVGMPRTYVRDLLHVGAGVWLLGWRAWRGSFVPVTLTAVALAGIALVPLVARRVRAVRSFSESVAGDDERWAGLVLYTLSFCLFTFTALHGALVPSAAALASLALGDGVGGLVGRRFGRAHYRVPGGKQKSLEGTLAVALFAALGIAAAGAWLGAPVGVGVILAGALTAAVVEAVSPRSSDNLLVPAAVFFVVRFLAGGGS